MKRSHLRSASALAIILASSAAGQAFAQGNTVQEVVVTGSLIRGTPEDAALPVDVIGAEELSKQGNPSTVELLKALPSSQAVLGDSNQFDARAQGTEGVGSVNLRALGAARTLVLLNGRRLAGQDTNQIPAAAIGRVEVLKDGAAVTYGSDAIGGVVNFITVTGFDGLQLSADYRYIDGSDGDFSTSARYGWVGENGNVLLSATYSRRSELQVLDRDWAVRPFAEVGSQGGYSILSNPGVLSVLGSGAGNPVIGVHADTGCGPLGGTLVGVACNFSYASYDNLVEPEDRLQLYAEANADLSDNMRLHVEAMYSKADITMRTSPGYGFLYPTAPSFSPRAPTYFVPAENPGLLDYVANNPALFPQGNNGVVLSAYRVFSFGGNPLYRSNGIGSSEGKRDRELARVSAELSGEFDGGIGYNVSLTYGQTKNAGSQSDTVSSRFQLALRGLGGPDCNFQTGTPGVGPCMWFYPLSNSIEANSITGQTNPGYNPALANNNELIRWFFQEETLTTVNRLFVAEAVLNGELPITLPGGNIAWAFGAQYRLTNYSQDATDGYNLAINPCVDTPITGNTACASPAGTRVFLGGFYEADLEQTAYAVFTEFQLPVTDDINVQLAARFEDYGGGVGSTFDPKASVRWQIIDQFAVRGSVGTTFRAPPITVLQGQGTSLQNFFGSYRGVDLVGNPDLKPESAFTYSIGGMLRLGGLRATLDYYSFEFKDPIITEPTGALVSTMFPGTLGAGSNCGNPAYAALEARFTFLPGSFCDVASDRTGSNISRIRTLYVNGSDIKTSGIDLLADYDLPWQPFETEITVGTSLTYMLEYEVDAFFLPGFEGTPVQRAFDGVGFLNYQTSIFPLPELKGSIYADFTRGAHNLRLTANYIDSYVDQRACPNTAPTSPLGEYYLGDPDSCLARPLGGLFATLGGEGRVIDETITLDASYRWLMPWDTTFVIRVANVFDEDPSFARLEINYDPFTGNPLGRNIKVSLSKKF